MAETVEHGEGGLNERRIGPVDSGGPRGPDDDRRKPVSVRSRRGLDWLVFFVADVQTGFGPFVAVFLTSQKWTQVDIGLILTVSGLVSLVGQIPMGALVDSIRSVRTAAMLALVIIGISAFAFAIWPVFSVVLVSRVAHAAASCILGLALVSLSLSLIGPNGIGERLGRNAAFASAGTGIAAAIMGTVGYYVSNQAVFFLTGALVVPAIVALLYINPAEINPARVASRRAPASPRALVHGLRVLARNRPLVIFAACVAMFHLANAAMLPLAASMLTLRSSEAATVMVAASMVVPQFTVTLFSPWVGRAAGRWGRRPLLLLGFGALVLRGILFAVTEEPVALVLIQVLDGISAATLGVLVPLTVADLTGGSGHFNLAQGAVGCAMGIGASISTTLTGYMADTFGSYTAFGTLAALAAVGLVLAAFAMPETRPTRSGEAEG